MSPKDLDQILSAEKLTAPSLVDKALVERIKKNQNYQAYVKKIS